MKSRSTRVGFSFFTPTIATIAPFQKKRQNTCILK